jgi:hypothetical protein
MDVQASLQAESKARVKRKSAAPIATTSKTFNLQLEKTELDEF